MELLHFDFIQRVMALGCLHRFLSSGKMVMVDMNDYDEVDDDIVDDAEAGAAEKGAQNSDERKQNDIDVSEAETLTVTAKQAKRETLEEELAAFFAKGGKITEVPPDDSGLE